MTVQFQDMSRSFVPNRDFASPRRSLGSSARALPIAIRVLTIALIVAGLSPLLTRSANAAGGGDKAVIWALVCDAAPRGTPWHELDCDSAPGVAFRIDADETSLSMTTGADGFLQWTGDTTFLALAEYVPAGYRVEAYCSLNDTVSADGALLWVKDLVDNGDGSAATALAANKAQTVMCAFYNIESAALGVTARLDRSILDVAAIPADGKDDPGFETAARFDRAVLAVDRYTAQPAANAAPTTATVSIDPHSCPDDFLGTGFYQYLTACISEAKLYGLPLSLKDSAGFSSARWSQPDGFGGASPMVWSGVTPGPVTISEVVIDRPRESVVFCSLRPYGNAVGSLDGTEIPLVNGAITINLNAGDELICDWHRFPGGVAGEPVEEPAPNATKGGSIAITKRICPTPLTGEGGVEVAADANEHDGDAAGALTGDPENDLAVYLATCQSIQDGVDFTLFSENGESNLDTFDGRVAWRDLAAGDYTIAEAIPAGYGDPVVFCEGNVPGRQYIRRNMVRHDATGGYIAFSMEQGETVACDWFNIFVGGADPAMDLDSDGDGISDGDEKIVLGTDPHNADTDGDGLSDGEEVWTYGSDPLSDDTDGDWLPDYNEVMQHGTNPANPDTDGDGVSDHDETVAGTDPLSNGGQGNGGAANAADTDGDGISDEDELNVFGSDPTLTDSDDDGLGDDEEVFFFGTDPLNDDTDGDGLVDGDEINTIWTDPLSFDTDGDGVDDGAEVYFNGTDPLDPASF